MNTETEKKEPYVFDKRTHKSIVAAETVLGPKALKRLVAGLFTGFSENNCTLDKGLADILNTMFNLMDPEKQVIIKTDAGVVGGIIIEETLREASIGDDMQGYTLIDLKTAIAEGIQNDLTGFVLQALQLKWNRELTLEDAENITFHLNKLIQLLK